MTFAQRRRRKLILSGLSKSTSTSPLYLFQNPQLLLFFREDRSRNYITPRFCFAFLERRHFLRFGCGRAGVARCPFGMSHNILHSSLPPSHSLRHFEMAIFCSLRCKRFRGLYILRSGLRLPPSASVVCLASGQLVSQSFNPSVPPSLPSRRIYFHFLPNQTEGRRDGGDEWTDCTRARPRPPPASCIFPRRRRRKYIDHCTATATTDRDRTTDGPRARHSPPFSSSSSSSS